MIFLLLGGTPGGDGEGDGESFWNFFGGSTGLLGFIQGLLSAVTEFLAGLPTWITG